MKKNWLHPVSVSRWLPWTLFTVVVILSLLAWGEFYEWQFKDISTFMFFPLFGLLAWSIMWTHYAIGGVRQLNDMPRNLTYTKVSAWIVLACLLLHPGLLAVGLWDTGRGLPPISFYDYVGPTMKYMIMFGTVSLLAFLAFDVFVRFRKHPQVDRNWRWISLSQMIAMSLIFVHALQLGGHLQAGWFQLWWIILGALLIPCFGLALRRDFSAGDSNRR